MNIALVVPSIRPDSLQRFLEKWRNEFWQHRQHLLVVIFETNGTPESGDAWRRILPANLDLLHLTQANVEEAWGEDAWILPQTNSSCRCFAMWEAYRRAADLIITQDDDAYPSAVPGEEPREVILQHGFISKQHVTLDWWQVAQRRDGQSLSTRGFPYKPRRASPVKFHQGLWTGVPDLDAITQLTQPTLQVRQTTLVRPIPRWNYFPMSWMNAGFHRDIMPAVCPPPSIMDKPTDRFDDTWTGICMKRIMDHLSWAATCGPPYVHHTRATDPFINLQIEARGCILQEEFWQYVAACPLEGENVAGLSLQLARHLQAHDDEYIRKTGEARELWVNKWKEATPF